MNPFKVLQRLDLKSIWLLVKLCLKYPLLVWPTLSATRECMAISTREFGKLHHKNGPANAFRHALWNFLIAQKSHKWNKNKLSVLKWTEKITDWHEHAFPNSDLAKKMDLHNNAMGRILFREQESHSAHHIVVMLKQMAAVSTKIDSNSDLDSLHNNLIHIVEEQ
ncbi:DUF6973 domain-containing protein [Flagellimonas algicola]